MGEIYNDTFGEFKNKIIKFSISKNGLLIAIIDEKMISDYNFNSKELLYQLKGHSRRVITLDFSFSDKYLISSSWDKTVKVWNFDYGKSSVQKAQIDTQYESQRVEQIIEEERGQRLNEACGICKRSMFSSSNPPVYCHSCDHVYHYKHLFEYLKINGNCPICKVKLRPKLYVKD